MLRTEQWHRQLPGPQAAGRASPATQLHQRAARDGRRLAGDAFWSVGLASSEFGKPFWRLAANDDFGQGSLGGRSCTSATMPVDGKPFSAMLDEWEAVEDAAIAARWAVDAKKRQYACGGASGPSPDEVARADDLSCRTAGLLVALQQQLRRERRQVPVI